MTTAFAGYVLRGNGPTAFKYDKDLETVRNAGRMSMEAERQKNRLGMRATPTYRDLNPPPPRSSRAAGARPIAYGANGEKIEFDGKAWIPAK